MLQKWQSTKVSREHDQLTWKNNSGERLSQVEQEKKTPKTQNVSTYTWGLSCQCWWMNLTRLFSCGNTDPVSHPPIAPCFHLAIFHFRERERLMEATGNTIQFFFNKNKGHKKLRVHTHTDTHRQQQHLLLIKLLIDQYIHSYPPILSLSLSSYPLKTS